MTIEAIWMDTARTHVAAEYPREACGVVVVKSGKEQYIPCRNTSRSNAHFVMHAGDYAAAEEIGEIVHMVHSHPNHSALPSEADKISCELHGVPWTIISWPDNQVHTFHPTGYRPALIGRRFEYGITDCFTLFRDYYKEKLNIDIPFFHSELEWWLHGENLYMDNIENGGFALVTGLPQEHDVLFMQIQSPVPNHAAVYIGDNMIMHHCRGRLSSRDIWGGYWRRSTVKTIRHRSLLHA